jgi:hypothetical protein
MEQTKRVLHFMAPTVQCAFDENNKDFLITGEAIHAVTTRNGHTFTVEELQRSAATLQNKPLLKDHINSVDSVVGRVTKAVYNNNRQSIDFVAKVSDKAMREKISAGDVVNVSVGAMVEQVEEVENEGTYTYTLKGIEFLELSLVAVPADPTAGFSLAQAIISSFHPSPAAGNVYATKNNSPAIVSQNNTTPPAVSASQEENTKPQEAPEQTNTGEEEASTMDNDKSQEALMSAISKLTDAVTAINDKVAALETKKVEEKAPVAAAPAAPESKGLVGQSTERNVASTTISLVRTEGNKIGIAYEAYDQNTFKNLARSAPAGWRAE